MKSTRTPYARRHRSKIKDLPVSVKFIEKMQLIAAQSFENASSVVVATAMRVTYEDLIEKATEIAKTGNNDSANFEALLDYIRKKSVVLDDWLQSVEAAINKTPSKEP